MQVMEITQLGSVPTEPPSEGKTEKAYSGKLKTFLISPSVFQHISKNPALHSILSCFLLIFSLPA